MSRVFLREEDEHYHVSALVSFALDIYKNGELVAIHHEGEKTVVQNIGSLMELTALRAENDALKAKLNDERQKHQDTVRAIAEHEVAFLLNDSPVGACNCLTKTPEVELHKPGCKYRLIRERDDARTSVAQRQEWGEAWEKAFKESTDQNDALRKERENANMVIAECHESMIRQIRERDAANARAEAANRQIKRVGDWLMEHPIDGEPGGGVDQIAIARMEKLAESTAREARLREALEFYAHPYTYTAIMFAADSPHGEFMDDFSEVEDDYGVTIRPGKTAREALAQPEQPAEKSV